MTISASAPAPTPTRDAEGASAVIAATLNVSSNGADVAAVVELFSADLRSNGGLASTLISSPARIAFTRDEAAAAVSPRRPAKFSPSSRINACRQMPPCSLRVCRLAFVQAKDAPLAPEEVVCRRSCHWCS